MIASPFPFCAAGFVAARLMVSGSGRARRWAVNMRLGLFFIFYIFG
jgi:hypothetical protein